MKTNTGMTKAEAGRKGGQAVVAKRGREYMRSLGKRGGAAVVAKYGTHHMSAIGYAGALMTAELYYQGDLADMMAQLRQRNTTPTVWCDIKKAWVKTDSETARQARDAAIQEIVNIFSPKL